MDERCPCGRGRLGDLCTAKSTPCPAALSLDSAEARAGFSRFEAQCPACRGAGQVLAEQPIPTSRALFEDTTDPGHPLLPRGKLPTGSRCPKCAGKGTIPHTAGG